MGWVETYSQGAKRGELLEFGPKDGFLINYYLIHSRSYTYSFMVNPSMGSLKVIHGRNGEHKAGNSQSPMATKIGKMSIIDVSPGDYKGTYRNQRQLTPPEKPHSEVLR